MCLAEIFHITQIHHPLTPKQCTTKDYFWHLYRETNLQALSQNISLTGGPVWVFIFLCSSKEQKGNMETENWIYSMETTDKLSLTAGPSHIIQDSMSFCTAVPLQLFIYTSSIYCWYDMCFTVLVDGPLCDDKEGKWCWPCTQQELKLLQKWGIKLFFKS